MNTRSRSVTPENDVFNLEIVPEKTDKPAGTSAVDFGGLLPQPLLLHEDLKEGCGGQLWPAGMLLAKYMLEHHKDLRGKSVLEIGAGGGLVGLAVARGCLLAPDQKVLLTDQIPMLSLMRTNIQLNNLAAFVQAEVYDWGEEAPEQVKSWLSQGATGQGQCPDIVLAADCVYFEPTFPLLLKTLQDLVGQDTNCYFCFKKRRKADMRFIRDLKKTFLVEDIHYPSMEADRRESLFLYSVRKRKIA